MPLKTSSARRVSGSPRAASSLGSRSSSWSLIRFSKESAENCGSASGGSCGCGAARPSSSGRRSPRPPSSEAGGSGSWGEGGGGGCRVSVTSSVLYSVAVIALPTVITRYYRYI